jgi:G:T-mismatch repair DNA endonuclease (very short patch repair protein)
MLSEEHKKKISDSLKGHRLSEETKRKISETLLKSSLKGRKLSAEHKVKIGLGNKGKKRTLEQRLKISENSKKNKWSEERKQKWSLLMKGDNNISKRHDVRIKLSKKMKENINNGTANISKMIKNDTKPELMFENILKNRNINHVKQFNIDNKFYDFFIPHKNLLVEIHGDYWHANPKYYNESNLSSVQIRNIKNDIDKIKLAKKHGYKIIHIWQSNLEEGSTTREMSLNNNSLHELPTTIKLVDDIV